MRDRIHTVGGQRLNVAGWRPPLHDHRDCWLPQPAAIAALPRAFSLRPHWITIYDQGEIGSCTANGAIEAFRFNYWKLGRAVPDFSRLAQYFWTRTALEGARPQDDSGCSVRDAIKALARFGACPEEIWPYDPRKFAITPPPAAVAQAAQHQVLSYRRVPGLAALKAQLCNWYPVVFGFAVYESMMTDGVAGDGHVPVPAREESVQGGHCVVAVGYDDDKKHVVIANSWGDSWGDGGFGFLPYWFFEHRAADDMWVILREEQP